MRIHRGYLFWGIFFVLLGGIPLLARAGVLDGNRFGDLGRWWPVLLIAVGIAIVLARTRAVALIGTVIAGLIVGGIAGGALAFGGGWVLDFGDCGATSSAKLESHTAQGTFTGPAGVDLVLDCGTVDVQAGATTSSLTGWTLTSRSQGAPPEVRSTGTSLSVSAPKGSLKRQEWDVLLPPTQIQALGLTVNAGNATGDLTAATLTDLDTTINAGEARLQTGMTPLARLGATVNAGRLRLTLGGATTGEVAVNAGSLDLCVPPDATLRLDLGGGFAFSTNLADQGLAHVGSTWTRAGTSDATITLHIEGNAGSLELDPAGGCA
ncbi:MAG: DUF5668 domain-containing protein [Chloroflexota bacterium]